MFSLGRPFTALAVVVAFLSPFTRASVPAYGQCGGIGYTGSTVCDSGSVCTYSNDYYSQCVPGTNGGGGGGGSGGSSNATFTNPLKNPNGSDPFMVYSNGYYYLMSTTWSNLQISRATTMAGLKSAQPKVVWSDSTAARCCNMWAPEIHQVSGSWYIYYTAGPSGNYDGNRIHAVKASSSDIWASSWSYAGQLVPANRNKGSLDGTVLNHSSGNYLVYSSWEDGVGQCLYIAKMNSPTSVGNAVMISKPTNSWEKVGTGVNEGPAPLYHGGRTWIVFSASLCSTTGYSLGRIELTGSDPLQASSWVKYNAGPIFSAANGNYGVGHNGFFTAPSGNVYNVYHASPSSTVTCDGNRRTMVQSVSWNSDGTPNLGQPRPLSEAIPEPA